MILQLTGWNPISQFVYSAQCSHPHDCTSRINGWRTTRLGIRTSFHTFTPLNRHMYTLMISAVLFLPAWSHLYWTRAQLTQRGRATAACCAYASGWFLFVIIDFFAISYGWEVISGDLSKSSFFKAVGHFEAKFLVEGLLSRHCDITQFTFNSLNNLNV